MFHFASHIYIYVWMCVETHFLFQTMYDKCLMDLKILSCDIFLLCCYQFVQADSSVLPRRMREKQQEARRAMATPDSDESEDEQPSNAAHNQVDEERAMDEMMMNYLVDDDLPYEREEVHHNRRPREKLWDEAKHHAEARIYDGARLSRLSSILEILNLQAKYKASNVTLDNLFRILHELILTEGNSLPSSWKEAKKVLRTIGMEYEIIHACPNDCILYQKEYKNCKECPECDTPRYKENMVSKKVPRKAMRYFPLIPRLLHTYRCFDWAEYQVWHSKHMSDDGVMRMAVDSPSNKFVEAEWPDFQRDPRHVRLGLATDGISPFNLVGKAQPYSIWPVVLMNYNIPPWMSMKKGHLILSMLIPGPKQPTNLNVYMAIT